MLIIPTLSAIAAGWRFFRTWLCKLMLFLWVAPLLAAQPAQPQTLTQNQCLSIVQQVLMQTEVPAPLQSLWQARLQQLVPYKSACYPHADFLAVLGIAELNSGRPADAQDTLERALMLKPDHTDALIHYAQVLNQLGQPFAAYDLNQQLLARRDLPQAVTEFLQQRERIWGRRFSQTSLRLTAALGYDSNLNTAADLATLTLGNGATYVLDRSSQPVSGTVINLNAGVRHARIQNNGLQLWQANLYTRTGAEANLRQAPYRHDQRQLDLHFKRLYTPGRRHPDQPTLAWGVTARQFWYNRDNLFQSLELQLERRAPRHNACTLEQELRLARQHYPGNAQRDAAEIRLLAGLECPLSPNLQLYSQLGLAYNQALDGRAGGDNRVKELILAAQYRQGGRLWSLSGRLAYTDDQQAYSPGLMGDVVRTQRNLQLALQLQQPITPALNLELSLSRLKQKSNLVLFEYDAERATLALDWRF